MIKFDRTKPYGEVHGEAERVTDPDTGETRVLYVEQDGFPFDAKLQLIEPLMSEETKRRYANKLREAEATAAAKAAFDEAMRKSGVDVSALKLVVEDPNAPQTVSAGDVDLKAWLAGNAKYRFDLVSEACRAAYNIKPRNSDQAKRLIQSNGTADLTTLPGSE